MGEITVQELYQRFKQGKEDFLLLDVREPFEYRLTNIEGKLIPLGQLPNRLTEIEEYRDREIITMCRSGARSAEACQYLEQQGFKKTLNLKGGINEWARRIDSTLPVY